MSSDTLPWGPIDFPEDNEIRLHWDQLNLRILRRGSDLLLLEQRNKVPPHPPAENVPEANFRRYAFQHPVKTIRAQPRTPERPLVVEPLHPLQLAPNAKVDFYVSVPVDIQLSTGEKKSGTPLERLRAEILSDTWFGDQMSGILCYALKSRARRESPTIDSLKTARAICRIQIHNRSAEPLHCTKFCLRLDHCHLWQQGPTLWASSVSVRYNGSDQLSAIDYSDKAPNEAPGATKITQAVEPPLRGLIRRTFAGIGTALS